MPRQLCLRLVDVLGKHRFDDLRGERLTDSLDPGPREADLDAPRRHVRVFFLADKVEFGRPDVGVAGELPHLVHRRPVADGVVDRRLAQRVDAQAAKIASAEHAAQEAVWEAV